MITKVLGFRLDFTGRKCSDLNFVNRNVIVDEAAACLCLKHNSYIHATFATG